MVSLTGKQLSVLTGHQQLADWCGRHYFYQLRPEYMSTPRGWFRTKYPSTPGTVEGSGFYSGNNRVASRRNRKQLILTQSLVIDIDGNKVRWPVVTLYF